MKISIVTPNLVALLCLFCSESSTGVYAFSPSSSSSDHPAVGQRDAVAIGQGDFEYRPKEEISFLLDEFTTSDGELVQPYQLLGVSRDSSRIEIRQAYIQLSKMYHPDALRHSTNKLPEGCHSEYDVRDQWERVKLAYEILSDRKRRLRYDRHSTIAQTLEGVYKVIDDPGAAMKDAAADAMNIAMNTAKESAAEFGNSVLHQVVDRAAFGSAHVNAKWKSLWSKR